MSWLFTLLSIFRGSRQRSFHKRSHVLQEISLRDVVFDKEVQLPNAAIKRAVDENRCYLSNNQCASSECGVEISVAAPVDHPVFKDCIGMNEKGGHYAGSGKYVVRNCVCYSVI